MKTQLFDRDIAPRAQRSASADPDSGLTPFVAASPEEIRYAERLRERLKERYPDRPSPPSSYWSVGAD